MTEEIKSDLSRIVKSQVEAGLKPLGDDLRDVRAQIDALDEKMQVSAIPRGNGGTFNLAQKFFDSPEFRDLAKKGRGTARVNFEGIDLKTLISSDTEGRATGGVVPAGVFRQDVVIEARRPLSLLDILPSRPTTFQVVYFLKTTTPMANAAEQSPEGAAKSENATAYDPSEERVRTIATWIPATRQLLEDAPALNSAIRGGLAYAVRSEIEEQCIFGTGAGETLHGIWPQATAFDNGLLPGDGASAYTKIDRIGWAVAQIAAAKEVAPTFALVHPLDLWAMRMTKDSQGRYILGDPQNPNPPRIFGVLLLPSTALAEGQFLVGSNDPAAIELAIRMELMIDISTEHEDYFTKNKVALRAESRLAQIVYRPNAFIKGALTSSPA